MKTLLSVALTLSVAARALATVTLNMTAAYLNDAGGTPMPTTGLVLLVASTSDSTFGTPTFDSFVSGDDTIIAKWDLSTWSTPGLLLDSTGPLALTGGWNAGDPLQIYWFPTLTLADLKPSAAGNPYGSYRTSTTIDGGDPWTTPADGATVTLKFLTADAGGSNPNSAGNASSAVAKADPTITTLPTASAITYGQSLAASTLSGGVASVPGTFAFTTPGTTPNAGTASHAVTFTPTDTANYNTVSTAVNVTVNPKAATVVADAKSKTYGEANPALSAVVTGEVAGGDAINYTLATTAVTLSGVGSYPIEVTLGLNPNYAVTKTDAALTVNAKAATVVANNWLKTYGDAVIFAGTEFNTSGFISGDGVTSVTLTSAGASPAATVGNYAILAGAAQGTGLANYIITYSNGTLSVSKATLTARADDKGRAFGEVNPPLTISYAGFVNGDDTSDLDVLPTASTTATISSPAGTYAITVTGGADDNYAFNLVNGTLTIVDDLSPEITSITMDNGLVTITWNAIAGREYKLQYKDNMTDAVWTEMITTVLATGPTASAENLVGNLPQRFYRVRLLPAP